MGRLKITLPLLMLVLTSGVAQAGKCVGLEQLVSVKKQTAGTPALLDWLKSIPTSAPPVVDCTSLKSVFSKVVNGKRTGGRKLEEEKPYDPVAAQTNLDQAMENADVRAGLDALQATVADEGTRLLFEAAILDAEGFYDARELRIQQLRAKLGD